MGESSLNFEQFRDISSLTWSLRKKFLKLQPEPLMQLF